MRVAKKAKHGAKSIKGKTKKGAGKAKHKGKKWTAPGILEALIPGRMQSHACTAEVPR